jgi:DNA-binding response OmpR family regulator
VNARKPVIRNLGRFGLADDPTPYNIGSGIRIVIVDDERDAVMTLGILLRSEGFDVRLVHAGADVPAAVAEVRPHAVLLDIGMPDRSGYEVANDLRATHGERCPVLIAVTGRVGASDRTQAETSGFKHYVTKPYDPTELLSLLSSLRPEPQPRKEAA